MTLRHFALRGRQLRDLRLPIMRGLVFVERGTCAVIGRDAWQAARRGSAVVVGPGTELRLSADAELSCFALDGETRTQVIPADEIAVRRRLRLLRELLRSEDAATSFVEHLVSAFIDAVDERSVHAVPRVRDADLSRALALALRDLSRRYTVSELATAVGMSRAAFARRFREALGDSPERYLTRRRLERAAKRLVTSDDGLASIAADVGFSSEQAFGRAFRRQFGVSPGAYRDAWRQRETCLAA